MTDDLNALERLYADVGGVQSVPVELLEVLPRDKADYARVDAAARLGYPTIAPILRHLLMWLQDGNWPIAGAVARLLGPIGAPLVPHVRAVLGSADDLWKYWVLIALVEANALLVDALKPDLERIATRPTPGEQTEEVDEIARGILTAHGP